jgi:hypothetical protein
MREDDGRGVSERIEKIKAAVEKRFGGTARHISSTPVRDTLKGMVVWEGVVETFDIALNSPVKTCYGFMYRENDETRYATVAGTDAVNSPEMAVKAFVAAMIVR